MSDSIMVAELSYFLEYKFTLVKQNFCNILHQACFINWRKYANFKRAVYAYIKKNENFWFLQNR